MPAPSPTISTTFWKVLGFQPNEVVKRGGIQITADAKGRLKHIDVVGENRRSNGETTIPTFEGKDVTAYYDDDNDCPIPKDQIIDSEEYPRSFQEGDWVHFQDGVTCQIIKKYGYAIPAKKKGSPRYQTIIKTMFGSNTVFAEAPLKVLYDRERLGALRRNSINQKKLTSRQLCLVARYIEADFDIPKTFLLHHKKPMESAEAQKYAFLAGLRIALLSDQGRKYFAEIFCRRFKVEMTYEEWRQKIEKSIPEVITKPIHLEMHMVLGKLSPEVRKKLAEAEGAKEEDGGSFKLPQTGSEPADAEYQDVCKVCNDTKIVKTTTTSGMEVEVECPACKVNGKPLPEVSEGTLKLRV
jgi:hypothetical protein